MSTPGPRAWAFRLPDQDLPADLAGLQLTPRGGIAMVAESDAVRQAIMLLLATAPGERVMRPDYGCDLRRLAFLPNNDTTAGLAIHYVREALERWEPRITLVSLDARSHPERPEILDILLEYRVHSSPRNEQLTLPVSLTGEEL